MPQDLADTKFDGIQLIEEIGAGGMGIVWRAHDTNLDIPIAVKVLPPHLASNQGVVTRFLRESRAGARLDHRNIVRVYKAGRADHGEDVIRYFSMELIDGRDLENYRLEFDGGRVPPDAASRIILPLCRALRYAHRQGVIHRDIKPSNVLISDDGEEPKLLDFGIAAMLQAGQLAAPSGQAIGTLDYRSPEQSRGEAVESSSDIFSLGVVFFEMLTGLLPFGSSADGETETHDLSTSDALPEVIPGPLFGLLREMLSSLPSKRPTLREIADRIEEYLGQSHEMTRASQTRPLDAEGNLAEDASSFVGRADSLQELDQAIESGKQLLTLLGPAGVGKTRLACELGRGGYSKRFDSVWFLDLSTSRSAEDIARKLAETLALPLGSGDIYDQLHAAIRYRQGRTLYIFDNFEQVTDAAQETLGRWSQDVPGAIFLVTSREVLHLEGEVVFNVPALTIENDGEALSTSSQLLLDRIRAVKPDFTLEDGDIEILASIVRLLDGVPLAIELAAARMSLLNLAELAERLKDRFTLLRSQRRDLPDRQQTLFDAIDWSWQLLKPEEQTALMQASIFEGGFFLEAAEEVLDISEEAPSRFEIDVVEALVEKSLLTFREDAKLPGDYRYSLLESIRLFAKEKFEALDSDLREAVQERHFEACLGVVEELTRMADGAEREYRMRVESANCYAAIEATKEARPQACAELLLGMRSASIDAMQNHVAFELIRKTLENAEEIEAWTFVRLSSALAQIEVSMLVGLDIEALIAQARKRAEGIDAQKDPETSAMALALVEESEGVRLHHLGQFTESVEAHRKALEHYRPFGKDAVYVRLLRLEACALVDLGEHDAARKSFEEGEALARSMGLERDLLAVLGRSVGLYNAVGDFDRTLVICEELDRLAAKLNSKRASVNAGFVRALVAYARQDYKEAVSRFIVAEEGYRSIGDERNAFAAMGNRATIYANLGENELAIKCQREALAVWERRGNRMMMIARYHGIGMALSNLERYSEALEQFVAAEEIARELKAKPFIAAALGSRAINALEDPEHVGDLDVLLKARGFAREAWDIHCEIGAQKTRLAFDARVAGALVELRLIEFDKSSLELAKKMAQEASELGEAAGISRTEELASGGEQMLRSWRWIDEVLSAG